MSEYKHSAKDIKSLCERRIGIPPEELSTAALREAGMMDHVCVLPEAHNERERYLADVLVQMFCRAPKDDRLRAVVGNLCQALSYMMNSASWREVELHDFDLQEVKAKLRRVWLANRAKQ